VGILLEHLGGAPPCIAGRPSYLLAQAKMSKFCLSKAHSSLRPFSVRVDHMVIVSSGSGDHCTFHRDDSAARIVTVPPFTGNFNIPCAVDVEWSSSPIFTSREIWPIGQMVSPLNPMSDVVAGIIWLLTSGRSLTKQCSYRTSEDAPPSTYIRCMKCPSNSASMIIGPSVPSSSPKDGKEIVVLLGLIKVTILLR
ncbi:hypothetical protein Tco_1324061, partial [Tanacetum coccineum]